MRSALDVAKNPQPYQIPFYMPPFPALMGRQRERADKQDELQKQFTNFAQTNKAELSRLRGDLTAYRQEAQTGFRQSVAFPKQRPRLVQEPEEQKAELKRLEPLPAPPKLGITIQPLPSPKIPQVPAMPLIPEAEELPSPPVSPMRAYGFADEEFMTPQSLAAEEPFGSDESEVGSDVGSVGSVGSEMTAVTDAPSFTASTGATTQSAGEQEGGFAITAPAGRRPEGLLTANKLSARMRKELDEAGAAGLFPVAGQPQNFGRLTRRMITDASGIIGKGRTTAVRRLAAIYGIDIRS